MPTVNDAANAERSRLEVEAFKVNKPDRYFAYRGDNQRNGTFHTITTWTGEKLGHVLSLGDVYRSNFGDRRRHFRALGVNGVEYSGVAYLDAGDHVRLRAVRS
jgi:hypothetical protein